MIIIVICKIFPGTLLTCCFEHIHHRIHFCSDLLISTCAQVTGRMIVLSCIWLCNAQGLPRCAVWDLYTTWAFTEIIRYGLYIYQNVDDKQQIFCVLFLVFSLTSKYELLGEYFLFICLNLFTMRSVSNVLYS